MDDGDVDGVEMGVDGSDDMDMGMVGPPPTPAEQHFIDVLRVINEHECSLAFECPQRDVGELLFRGRHASKSECVASGASDLRFEGLDIEELLFGVANGRVVFDSAASAACIASLENLLPSDPCSGPFASDSLSSSASVYRGECSGVFEAQAEVGGACASDVECDLAAGLQFFSCIGPEDGEGPCGTCQEPFIDFGPCGTMSCSEDQFCQSLNGFDAECVDYKMELEPCGPGERCEPGTACSPPTGATVAVCQALGSVNVGGDCSGSFRLCMPELLCSEGTCIEFETRKAGEACAFLNADARACEAGTTCVDPMPGSSVMGVCGPARKEGESCTYLRAANAFGSGTPSLECAPGLVCVGGDETFTKMGTCQPPLQDGAPCASRWECASERCQQGTCAQAFLRACE